MIGYISYIIILSYITLAIELVFFPVKSPGSTYRILKEKKVSFIKSVPILASTLFVIAVIMYPLANLFFEWQLLASHDWLLFFGMILIGFGRWMSLGAMLQLRKNRTALQQDGFFKWTRNPNIDGTMAFLLGMWLIMPHVLYLIATVLVFLYLKSRAKIEENHLLVLFGEKYTAYKNKTRSSLYL